MGNALPSFNTIIQELILAGIVGGATWLWNNYRPKAIQYEIPDWLSYIAGIYSIITLMKFTYSYIDLHKPIEEHYKEVFDHQTIVLDGKSFRACEFTDCKLIINGYKPFKMITPRLIRTSYSLEKRAILGINILLQMKDDSTSEKGVNAYFDLLKTKRVNHDLLPTDMDE